jgi:hypothetical protein
MRNLVFVLGLTMTLAGCARTDAREIPAGTDVTVQKKDGASLAGRLVEVNTEQVVIEGKDGVKTSVPLSLVESVKPGPAAAERADAQAKAAATTGEAPGAAAPRAPAPPEAPAVPATEDTAKRPEFREVTVPAGTVLRVTLATPVASDTSHVEDAVRATLRSPVTAEGIQALPVGTALLGHVTSAQRSAKVKGRASVGVRFNTIDLPGDGGRESIRTGTIVRVAPATKKKDAAKIGIGAGAGAVIGGIIGGGDGAAKGAAIGGGAGTGAVLATRGDEVRLAAGTPLAVKLTAPLTVRVPLK